MASTRYFGPDTTDVASAGAVMDADFTAADEIMVGTGSGTHNQVTLAASEFLAKKAAGAATNVSAADARTILNVEDGADATDATNVEAAGAIMDGDFTSNGIMRRTGAGSYASGRVLSAKTDNYSVLVTDAENAFTMAAGAEKTFSLPSVDGTNVGLCFTFINLDGNNVIIDPADSDTIDDSTADTGNISSSTQYGSITLMLASATEWVIIAANGTWTTT